MTHPKTVVGYALVGFSVLMEAGESIEFISGHMPRWLVNMIDQKVIFVLVVVGFLLLLMRREEESEQPSTTQNIKTGDASASAGNASAASKLADVINLGPQPLPPPAPIPPKRRVLHISPIKVRIAWVNESGAGGYVFYEAPATEASVKAILADFRNEPQGEFPVISWHHVQLSIFYYDEHGTEVAEVSEGHWMEQMGIKTTLARHKTETLIVAVRANDAWISFDGGDTTKLPGSIKSAKIVLHDDREFELSFSLQMDLNVPMVCCLESITPQSSSYTQAPEPQ